MNIINYLFTEHCPKCNKILETRQSKALQAIVVKSCPDMHFRKEFHPALETYIESYKVS